MAAPEFEEKEYEFQFALELAAGRLGTVWSAGQVIEGIVGFDGVSDPDVDHVVWQVLNVDRPPGIVLAPAHWRGGQRPSPTDLVSRPVSLVLQYKRAERIIGARAKQWHLWRTPYFRFSRSSRQHSILRRLENALREDAVVRYAAPAFWTRAELEAHAVAGKVISNSGFVSPMTLGSHKVWTYLAPGTHGRGNESGREADFESSDQLLQVIARPTADAQGEGAVVLRDDLPTTPFREVAAYRQPRLRSGLEVLERNLNHADIPISQGAIRAIVGVAAMTSLARAAGGNWYLARRG